MKKINYLCMMLITLLGVICVGTLNVNAKSAPSSITIKSKSSLYYYSEKKGTDYIGGYNFYRKELTDGTLGYCVSNIDTKVPAGKTLSSNGVITDKGLDYIIRNGYPHKSFTGNSLKDYYITQSAIWEYFDETNGSHNWKTSFTSSDSGMKGYVYKLVNAAKKENNKSSKSSSITLNVDSNNMSLTSDGNYYFSELITVKMTNTSDTYKVNLSSAPAGSLIKNENGETKEEFSKGEKFRIYVPASKVSESGSIKVNVTTTYVKYTTYSYSYGSSSYQDIAPVTIYKTNKKITSSDITLKYNKVTTKLKISKQDITSKEELPGATLVIKDTNGKVIDSWVSGSTPHYIEGLKTGKYTLTETIAPSGYILSTESIEFTLEANGKIKTVIMYNSKENITKVKISKQDITSKEELPGATLVIKDKNGKVIDSWVSGSTPHYIEGLKPGNYTLTETQAPNGYKLSSETIEFTVKNDGTVNSVVMYNEKYSVPITDLDVNMSTVVGSLVLIIFGMGMVFYAKRSYQK